MVVGHLRLELACRRGALGLPLAGKFKRIRVRCVPVAIECDIALCFSDLSVERCLLALPIARGEGLSGRESLSWPNTIRQRWAIE